jgi:hypothetical protein
MIEQQLIDAFELPWTPDFNADDIAGECYHVSLQFMDHLDKYGIQSELIHLMDWMGEPFPNIHEIWFNEDFYNHYVVRVGDLTYDFTHRQFNPESPVPLILTIGQLKEDWDTVEVESRESEEITKESTSPTIMIETNQRR